MFGIVTLELRLAREVGKAIVSVIMSVTVLRPRAAAGSKAIKSAGQQ
jgi:hypothetical protein